MNRQAPENATTERLVRQKLEREPFNARLEGDVHGPLKGAASATCASAEIRPRTSLISCDRKHEVARRYKPCVEIKSPRSRPPRHRRDACSTAWRCRFVTARPSPDGHVIAFHTGTSKRATRSSAGRQKVQNEIDETRARLRAVLDKASAVEARNLRREGLRRARRRWTLH